jgi:hypothetical protein
MRTIIRASCIDNYAIPEDIELDGNGEEISIAFSKGIKEENKYKAVILMSEESAKKLLLMLQKYLY